MLSSAMTNYIVIALVFPIAFWMSSLNNILAHIFLLKNNEQSMNFSKNRQNKFMSSITQSTDAQVAVMLTSSWDEFATRILVPLPHGTLFCFVPCYLFLLCNFCTKIPHLRRGTWGQLLGWPACKTSTCVLCPCYTVMT